MHVAVFGEYIFAFRHELCRTCVEQKLFSQRFLHFPEGLEVPVSPLPIVIRAVIPRPDALWERLTVREEILIIRGDVSPVRVTTWRLSIENR